MAESLDWDVLIRCKKDPSHTAQVAGVQLNVDGHMVVPRQKPCDMCRENKLSRLEIRRWEKALLRQIREL